MYAPPPAIEPEVFARVPDKFRITDRVSKWATIQRGGRPTPCFLEGPSFDRDGNLYVVDVAWGRIFRISPSGEFTLVIEYDGEPNGLKIHRDGRIFIADYKNGIMLLDPARGAVTPVVQGSEFGPFKGVNDLVFASNGDLYFTDQGLTGLQDASGRLHRLRADTGRLDTILQGIPSPNGLVLGLEEDIVFVNVTRDNAVWRVPMNQAGAAFKVGAFIRLSGGNGPDGLAIDESGGLAIAHFGLGTVWIVNAIGEPVARVKSCAGLATTNVAYGGADRRTLYITESESGQILMAKVPTAGRAMYSHQ
ncbi:lactonase drp35 [Variibacter gotjawalensis]|uniref:Lactonase drp35 n=1 Tax=Variibacter gotjawalensis TaxID=1333996 RepID=A0A0S3Q0B7_9BRAD|nr:SMP-30/gluconolactonase/LRE family protein [Variibacter gotjawalensis]NIK47468.1 gluconolactonase [Variibacter gotjawalensis]RZS49363.1 gluconolactonase [Variibacter gotjawalensis]BAT61627.1 lactonase drp35 [Variibacter gotjawalensis]